MIIFLTFLGKSFSGHTIEFTGFAKLISNFRPQVSNPQCLSYRTSEIKLRPTRVFTLSQKNMCVSGFPTLPSFWHPKRPTLNLF